jgi:hypothetical protein
MLGHGALVVVDALFIHKKDLAASKRGAAGHIAKAGQHARMGLRIHK